MALFEEDQLKRAIAELKATTRVNVETVGVQTDATCALPGLMRSCTATRRLRMSIPAKFCPVRERNRPRCDSKRAIDS